MAYDPRDLNDEKEIGENPRLTLMEEILLLGLKDKQGYLSFWNDNISYTLRGCILIELALRRRIAITKDPMRKRFGLTERVVDVIDGKMTGEVLLDEALKMMKASDRMSVAQWVDLMSGKYIDAAPVLSDRLILRSSVQGRRADRQIRLSLLLPSSSCSQARHGTS